MGGTLGTAAFLSILFTTLPNKIGDAYAAARGTAAFQQAAQAHPEQLKLLSGVSGGSSSSLGDTSFVQQLDAALAAPFKTGFADSIDLVFLVAACVVAVGFFVMLFLPQLPLRTMSGIQAAQEGVGETTAPGEAGPVEDAVKAVGAAAPTSVPPANAPAAGDGSTGDGTAAGEPQGATAVGVDGTPRH
jgi:hypothetical protein